MMVSLSWESPFAIARALRQRYPNYPLDELSLNQLEHLIRDLEGFQDEPGPVHDELLLEVFRLWYEESLYGGSQ